MNGRTSPIHGASMGRSAGRGRAPDAGTRRHREHGRRIPAVVQPQLDDPGRCALTERDAPGTDGPGPDVAARPYAGRHRRCRRPVLLTATRKSRTGPAPGPARRWRLGRGHGGPVDADGVGKWMARDRSDGSLVGRGGFTRVDLDGETVLELGWAVATPARAAAMRPRSAGRRSPGPWSTIRTCRSWRSRGAQPRLAGGHGAARDAPGGHHPTCRDSSRAGPACTRTPPSLCTDSESDGTDRPRTRSRRGSWSGGSRSTCGQNCGQAPVRTNRPGPFHARKLVGAAGFEPTTTSPPDWCATRLRHAPTGVEV